MRKIDEIHDEKSNGRSNGVCPIKIGRVIFDISGGGGGGGGRIVPPTS